MKQLKVLFVLTLLLFSLLTVVAVPVEGEGKVSIIIGFNKEIDRNLVKSNGGEVSATFSFINAVAANVPSKAVDSLKRNPKVSYVEREGTVTELAQSLPWGVDRIDADVVQSSYTGVGIKVGVIDSGIDHDHPDLDANYKGGYDFVNDDTNPMDDRGHGTHVSGTIAAEDNDIGVVGVAPEASLYGIKVLDSSGSGTVGWVAAGIQWAITNEMDIITMSLGSDSDSTTMRNAVDAAYDAGILVVAAAGNDGNRPGKGDNVDYPGRYDSAIAVAASDSNDKRAPWSSTGPAVELTGPGVSIYSTDWNNDYSTKSGTSMATPHVTGVAALVMEANPTFTNVQVRQRLQSTAEDLGKSGRDALYGFGLVDAEAAVSSGGSTPLSVTITNPSDGVTVSGSVSITATTAGENPISSVTFSIDGTDVFTDTVAPYQYEWDTTEETDGSHSIKAVVTDSTGGTADDTTTVTVSNTQTGASMHVSAIDMWYTKTGRNYKIYTRVTIVDQLGSSVEGATVSLRMDLPSGGTASGSGLTEIDGTVTFLYGATKVTGIYKSTVTDIVKSGWTYDQSANVETSESLSVP